MQRLWILSYLNLQAIWKDEIKEQLQLIRCEGTHMPHLEEELIKRRREELRWAYTSDEIN